VLRIHLIRKPGVPNNDMIRCKQSILTHFLSIFDSLFRIRLIRSMISDTSCVEGRSCNQVFDIIWFYIASLWKTHFLFVWSNLWVSHWSCKSWYRSGCRYSGFPRFNSLSSSPNLSKYMDPQTQALFPLITMIVEELTARNIPVPPPHSKAWWTVSPTETLFELVWRQQVSFRQTIVPHIRQTVGSLGTRSQPLHFRLW